MRVDPKVMIEALRRVIKRLHYPAEVMLVCVRWYVAYPLSLRQLEEMMVERGVAVDHSTIHRWAMKILPVLAAVCRRRKLPVGKSWRMDETYVSGGGTCTERSTRAATRSISCCAPSEITLRPALSSNEPSTCTVCRRRSR